MNYLFVLASSVVYRVPSNTFSPSPNAFSNHGLESCQLFHGTFSLSFPWGIFSRWRDLWNWRNAEGKWHCFPEQSPLACVSAEELPRLPTDSLPAADVINSPFSLVITNSLNNTYRGAENTFLKHIHTCTNTQKSALTLTKAAFI